MKKARCIHFLPMALFFASLTVYGDIAFNSEVLPDEDEKEMWIPACTLLKIHVVSPEGAHFTGCYPEDEWLKKEGHQYALGRIFFTKRAFNNWEEIKKELAKKQKPILDEDEDVDTADIQRKGCRLRLKSGKLRILHRHIRRHEKARDECRE